MNTSVWPTNAPGGWPATVTAVPRPQAALAGVGWDGDPDGEDGAVGGQPPLAPGCVDNGQPGDHGRDDGANGPDDVGIHRSPSSLSNP